MLDMINNLAKYTSNTSVIVNKVLHIFENKMATEKNNMAADYFTFGAIFNAAS